VKDRATKTPGIPDIRDDNLVEVLRAIKATMEVRESHSGDPQDAHVTFRQLQDLGLVKDGSTKGSGGGIDLPVSGPGGGGSLGSGYDPSSDLSTPPAPTNLQVHGGFVAMYLSWEGGYKNNAFTEVWRNTVDDLSTAIMIGTSPTNLYTDPVEPDSTYYYWVRFHSRADVVGPFNQTAGTMGHSAPDVGKQIEALSDLLLNSPLWGALSQRIAQIEADQYILNAGQDAKLTELSNRIGSTTGRILELWNVTQNQATDLKLLESRGPGNGNAVYFSPERPDGATPGLVGGIALNAGDIWYDTDDDNRSYRWSGFEWIEFVTAGAKVYHQPNDPASFNGTNWVDVNGRILREGDVWYDSDDGNHPYRWNTASNAWDSIAGGDNSADIITLEQTKIGYATLNVNSPLGLLGAVFDNNGKIWNNTPPGDKDYANSAKFWNETHNDVPGVDSRVTWHIGLPFAQAVKQVGVVSNNYDGSVTNTTIEQKFIAMQNVDNSVLAQYTVKIDINGYVTGFGLAASGPASNPTSEFIVNADRFAIGPAIPQNQWNSGTIYALNATVWMKQNGILHVFQSRKDNNQNHLPTWGATKIEQDTWWVDLTARLPFIATTLAQTIDGKLYPPGVWMNTANIATATIVDAQIFNLTADKIWTGSLTATIGITTGKLWGGSLNFNYPVGDVNFGTGFFLGNDGAATVYKFFIGDGATNNLFWDGQHTLSVRGHIEAYSGWIAGIQMRTSSTVKPYYGILSSPDTVTDWQTGAGFFLDSNSYFRIGDPLKSMLLWDGANITIFGPQHQVVLSSGTGLNWNFLNNKPAGINNNEITITSTGVLQGAGGGQVTATGVGAILTDGSNAPLTLRNDNIRVSASGGNITFTGGPVSTASGIIMPGFQLTSTNMPTYMAGAAIGIAQMGQASIGHLQVIAGEIQTAHIGLAQVDSLRIGGNAVVVPSAAFFTQTPQGIPYEIVNYGGTVFFNGDFRPITFTLDVVTQMLVAAFTTELQQGPVNSGATIQLTCFLHSNNHGTQTQTFNVGIINNQPQFAQTAVFTFTALQPDGYWMHMEGKQTRGGSGNTIGGGPNDNQFGKKVLTITCYKR
jgi:hypothetical protein